MHRPELRGDEKEMVEALFDRGAAYPGGSVITDPQRVLEGIRAGWPFRFVKRNGSVRFTCWTRADLPV